MKDQQNPAVMGEKRQSSNNNHLILILISLAALLATFFLAASGAGFLIKAAIFGGIVFIYLMLAAGANYLFRSARAPLSDFSQQTHVSQTATPAENESAPFNHDVESRLFALEEANQFFGASLKPSDMFRLVSSRVGELIPFAACAVFIADETGRKLSIEFTDGKAADLLRKIEINSNIGNAGKTFTNGRPQLDLDLKLEKTTAYAKFLRDFSSAAAVPLMRGGEVFGVLQLYGDLEKTFDEKSLALLDAVGTRVAPLFLSSLAFEQSLSNALTDALTNLPNERAFYLVLENQIAEAQRFRERRPLTVLAVDLKNFAEINQSYGHAGGDRLLRFAGEKIRDQLRQMDFIARSTKDEFLIILPTASEKIAREIIERITRAFVLSPFEISAENKVYLEFSFGLATFGDDGETAEQLLASASLRKYQSKSEQSNKIIFFPKEFVN